ncbi:hypothetical protein J6590_011693 [Homalodisca vitripennis]|nr:hypothetical protein J6590_011693 [Homalodisca vitripennis]
MGLVLTYILNVSTIRVLRGKAPMTFTMSNGVIPELQKLQGIRLVRQRCCVRDLHDNTPPPVRSRVDNGWRQDEQLQRWRGLHISSYTSIWMWRWCE